jgi:hypothetical protein
MLKVAIPVLHISSAERAEGFYCKRLGSSAGAGHQCVALIRKDSGLPQGPAAARGRLSVR